MLIQRMDDAQFTVDELAEVYQKYGGDYSQDKAYLDQILRKQAIEKELIEREKKRKAEEKRDRIEKIKLKRKNASLDREIPISIFYMNGSTKKLGRPSGVSIKLG